MTQAEEAHVLKASGLTWREVGEQMGISRTHAKNAGHYWRKREQIAAKGKERYAEHRERILDNCRAYREANGDQIKERRREQRLQNRDAINAKNRDEYAEHAEATNEARRIRYAEDEEHRGALQARSRQWRGDNLEQVRASAREYAKDPKRIEQRLAWVKANAAALAEKQRAYRAERTEHTSAVTREWQRRNAEHIRAYRKTYSQKHRPELLMRRSVWEFGPELGPLHRALCDLRAAVRDKQGER